MPLKLYDSLTRSKRLFVPLHADQVSLYVCGPTVYAPPHIGNARSAVVFDLLYRVLQADYAKVVYVRNITDVDDKIHAAAQKENTDIHQITQKYTAIYQDQVKNLGCLTPTHQPRVTQHIGAIIAVITKLLAAGHAYQNAEHVLFSVPSFPDYGKLAGRNYQEMMAGARVETADYKKHPADFVLWKPSAPDWPGWDSPWGRGRPGWHIECTAMAEQYLGKTIDIHGGGQDLMFPHHENEIAQGICTHPQHPYCRYWVHNGFVQTAQQKMSKSLGNILLVDQLLQEASGESIRFALLSTHYSQPLNWSEHIVPEAQKALHKWYTLLAKTAHIVTNIADADINTENDCIAALHDNLNTPEAISILHQWFKQLARLNHQPENTAFFQQKKQLKTQILLAGQRMGILQQNPQQWLEQQKIDKTQQVGLTVQEIETLLATRTAYRKAQDFARADAVRDQLLRQGIILDDTPQGTTWRYP